jgi:hypothetical protein
MLLKFQSEFQEADFPTRMTSAGNAKPRLLLERGKPVKLCPFGVCHPDRRSCVYQAIFESILLGDPSQNPFSTVSVISGQTIADQ